MEAKHRNTLWWIIVIACGWTIWAWVDAGNHGFSEGSKVFAITSTAFWGVAATVAAFRLWRRQNDS